MMSQKNILIFGYGYVTTYLCQSLFNQGWQGWLTSRQKNHEKAPAGFEIISFDHFNQIAEKITLADAILSTVPPDFLLETDPVLARYHKALTHHHARWIGYLSSTSVYGNHHGAWVDESSQCSPSFKTGQLRLHSEKQWLTFLPETHIFRLAGIYGPQRNPLVKIREGQKTTFIKQGHDFSRIHIEDLCNILIHSLANPMPGNIYNCADQKPAPLYEVEQFAAKILGQPALIEVPIDQAKLSERMQEFFHDEKKVLSEKILKIHGLKIQYPSYQEGLLSLRKKLTP